jgi:hypothetical protein
MIRETILFNELEDLFIDYTIEETDEIAAYTEYMVTLYVNGAQVSFETILADNVDQAHDHAEKMYEDYLEYIKS